MLLVRWIQNNEMYFDKISVEEYFVMMLDKNVEIISTETI